jgi:hypothetical protein
MKKNNSILKYYLKKYIVFLIILFTAPLLSYSQTLTFCERVDSSTGTPLSPSNFFTIKSSGGFITALVSMPKGISSSSVTYDIFRHNEDNSETFESTIKQNVQPEYTWFSKQITFHKKGKYNIYVYDGKSQLICVGRVTIKID